VFDQQHIDTVQTYVPDLQQCIFSSKQVIDSDLTVFDTTFVRFYKGQEYALEENLPNQLIFVAADNVDNKEDKYYRIAAIFQAYSSLGADSALVTNFVNFGDNHAMLTMCLSAENAYLFVQPFQIENNNIIWNEDQDFSSHVDDFDFDSTGNDIISMYYHFTHLNHVLYKTSEIYSFLSSLNIVFAPIPGSVAEVDYFDFSNFTEEQHQAIIDSFV